MWKSKWRMTMTQRLSVPWRSRLSPGPTTSIYVESGPGGVKASKMIHLGWRGVPVLSQSPGAHFYQAFNGGPSWLPLLQTPDSLEQLSHQEEVTSRNVPRRGCRTPRPRHPLHRGHKISDLSFHYNVQVLRLSGLLCIKHHSHKIFLLM